jgi:hypothetical protein
MISVTKTSFAGWPNCHHLVNRSVELVVTADVGPRIIHLARRDGRNVLGELADDLGRVGGSQHRLYGGHRLWHAPEVPSRTYCPDNEPVTVTREGHTLRSVQPAEEATGIVKRIDVTLHAAEPLVRVDHWLTNVGLWTVQLAPWALTLLRPGGLAVVPQTDSAPVGSELPNRRIALWPYTDMQDPRVHWGSRYLLIRHAPGHSEFKLGTDATAGWAAYWSDGELLVKCFRHQHGATYPDFGCSVEVYVCDQFLELETLGPMVALEPGATVQHTEHWFLYGDVELVASEEEADRFIVPLVQKCMVMLDDPEQSVGELGGEL